MMLPPMRDIVFLATLAGAVILIAHRLTFVMSPEACWTVC